MAVPTVPSSATGMMKALIESSFTELPSDGRLITPVIDPLLGKEGLSPPILLQVTEVLAVFS